MIPKTFKSLFILRKPQNSSTLSHIYLRVTINGIQKEISTGLKCPKNKWNQNSGRIDSKKEEFQAINLELDLIQQKVFEAKVNIVASEKELTADSIIDAVLGRNKTKEITLISVFQEHNDRFAELVGIEVTHTTWVRYKTTMEHVSNFIQLKYGASDIPVKDINFEFVEGFDHYLKTIKACNTNTTGRYMTNFKKIVTQCLKRGYITRDPFYGFKIKKIEPKRNVLTKEEINQLAEKQFSVERLEHVRDVFLFCCYTGLAYIDIKQLKVSNIQIGIDGEDWIFTSRQKTDVDTRVPLLPVAKALIEKYRNNAQCKIYGTVLPVPSNQKMNAYLKEVGDLCDIKKPLTTHLARHTFATTITLSNGVPIETVSKLLGHKNIKTTQHYAKILDLKVSHDIGALKSILEG